GKTDPKKTTTMQPKFIDGKGPAGGKDGPAAPPRGFAPKKGGFGGFGGRPGGLTDQVRRKSLAESVVSTDNPWFAGAFTNRLWGELMGQAFYMPIDDMGPEKDAYMPVVLARVSASFRGSDYDIKSLYRTIMNSETYQRQVRPGESAAEDHLLFAA